jgi:hypothetical protein
MFGDKAALIVQIANASASFRVEHKIEIAIQASDFCSYFSKYYDDKSFIRDAFGIQGDFPEWERGEQQGRKRVKLIYDHFAAEIRQERKDWKP